MSSEIKIDVKNRCDFCKKRNHLLFECKCNKKFGTCHLQPEMHNCECIEKFRSASYESNKTSILNNLIKVSKIGGDEL